MSELVPLDQIEEIVGSVRHPVEHIGRAISDSQTVYVLHSKTCLDEGQDLRECAFSLALDYGVYLADWEGFEDRPVLLKVDDEGYLIPKEESNE